ncbi:MAG TPA: site-specific integrase [Terriglobia bacterium]|nr:site-specific integrase [Terriglobia bacterium]
MESAYRIVTRKGAAHQHPVLVLDFEHRLHFPLTIFAEEAVKRSSLGTARTYLNAAVPFFSWLEADDWQRRALRKWNDSPERIRQAVHDYLVERLKCKVREHRAGFQLVSLTEGTRSTVRVFLSALKLYYRLMQARSYYDYANPLVDGVSATLAQIENRLAEDAALPRTPEISGVVAARPKCRLSDSYFKLVGETWVPQVIDDPQFPVWIQAGGLSVGWHLREQCVVRILFESGGRISEVVGLTVGDWAARGCLQEAQAFSKGSHGKRVKFLRFSAETAKLLRRYFDIERCRLDANHYRLDDYLQRASEKRTNLHEVPLFLSHQGTPLRPKTFRDLSWNRACHAAGVEADIHQARHWYVAQIIRTIYETTPSASEINRRLRELIEYMGWRSGWETLDAYQHYFDPQRHAEIQNELHGRMDRSLKEALGKSNHRQSGQRSSSNPPSQSENANQVACGLDPDSDLEYLFTLGGQSGSRNSAD